MSSTNNKNKVNKTLKYKLVNEDRGPKLKNGKKLYRYTGSFKQGLLPVQNDNKSSSNYNVAIPLEKLQYVLLLCLIIL